MRSAGVAAGRTPVVVVPLPAPPRAEDGVLKGIRTRRGNRAHCGVIENGGGSGDPGVGTEALLDRAVGEAQRRKGVEPRHQVCLAMGGEIALDAQEPSEAQHNQDNHRHHNQGEHQGEARAAGSRCRGGGHAFESTMRDNGGTCQRKHST
jgi:hypothetical protein